LGPRSLPSSKKKKRTSPLSVLKRNGEIATFCKAPEENPKFGFTFPPLREALQDKLPITAPMSRRAGKLTAASAVTRRDDSRAEPTEPYLGASCRSKMRAVTYPARSRSPRPKALWSCHDRPPTPAFARPVRKRRPRPERFVRPVCKARGPLTTSQSLICLPVPDARACPSDAN
jgi:hypothetical protein